MLHGLNEQRPYRSEYLTLREILTRDKPVLRCEGVEHYSPDREKGAVKCLDAESGLCMNCGDNHLCAFPSFGKNVIYCEEYV